MRSRTPILLAAAGIMASVVVSGCTVAGKIGLGPCVRADRATVATVKKAARTHFTVGDSKIDHATFVRASMAEIPSSDRRFGITHVLAVYETSWFENPVSTDLSGVYRTEFFGYDAPNRRIYPLTDLAAAGYEFETPDDPEWSRWAAGIHKSDAAIMASACANP